MHSGCPHLLGIYRKRGHLLSGCPNRTWSNFGTRQNELLCTSSGEMWVPEASVDVPQGQGTTTLFLSRHSRGERGPVGQRTISAAGHSSSPISRPRQLPAMLPTLAVPLLLELITVIIPVLLSSSSLLLSLPCPFICKSNHSVDFFKRKRGRESKDTNEESMIPATI